MSSTVIDFFHSSSGGGGVKPEYILRLRGTPEGIVDLAGNTITNYNVDYTSTPSTLGDGTALKFNGSNAYLDFSMYNNIEYEDFTISIQLRDIEYISLNNHVNTILSIYADSALNNGILGLALYAKNCPYYTTTWNDSISFYSPALSGDPRRYVPGIQNLTNFHLAIVRKNLITSLAINGVFVLNDISPIYNEKFITIENYCHIGYSRGTSFRDKYSKFILDDYCIIKGKALWTENFTPPTDYLPDNP